MVQLFFDFVESNFVVFIVGVCELYGVLLVLCGVLCQIMDEFVEDMLEDIIEFRLLLVVSEVIICCFFSLIGCQLFQLLLDYIGQLEWCWEICVLGEEQILLLFIGVVVLQMMGVLLDVEVLGQFEQVYVGQQQ